MKYIKTYEDKEDPMSQPYYDILQSVYHFIERMGFEIYFLDDDTLPVKSKKIIIKINRERQQIKIYAFEDVIRLTYNIKDNFSLFEFLKEILNDFVWSPNNLKNGLYFTLRENENVYDAINILDNTTKDDYEMFINKTKYNL